MEQNLLLLRLLISGSLGLLIGIEREHLIQKEEKVMAAGIRTFTLITLLGTLSSHISTYFMWFLPLTLFGLILLNIASYIQTSKKSVGLTSEIAILIAFLMGSLVYYGEEKIAIAITVIMVTLLSLRKISHGFVKKIKYSELLDTLKFAIIALVILPFLPNQNFGPFDFFNPRNVWLMVVFVSGISYVGYILNKVMDSDKGIKITGILGGLVSSTAVTSAMAIKSKEVKDKIEPLVFATVTATATMFLRLLILLFIVNPTLSLKMSIPLLVMSLTGILGSFAILRKDGEKRGIKLESPFRVRPALKFGLIFALILLGSKAANFYFGEEGTYLISLITGFMDIDPIALSISDMVGSTIGYQTAEISIFLALISNTIGKFFISFLSGNKKFWKKVGMMLLLMALVGLLTILLI
ncbi:MAG: DUF4010 domain-containing protein [Candidatus Aenigmarchaeota archaeon]|nr:DUF4010 domain-containing protein [Candidatus Aenigmarchaeota archaeon]